MGNKYQNLSPQYQEVSLREGGKLGITFYLAKGHSNARCVCGVGANGEPESYFQTIDTAALLVKITNKGSLGVRHLYATKVKVMRGDHEMTDPLPDGNLLFENVPLDVYYGNLEPGMSVTKEIELITRGTAPGAYQVMFDFSYAVEGCALSVALPISVCPD